MTDKRDETPTDLNHPVPKWMKDKFNERARAMGGLGKTFNRLIAAFVDNPGILDATPANDEMPLDTASMEIQVPPMLRSGLIAISTGPSIITEAMISEPEFLHLSGAELNTFAFLDQFITVLAERIMTNRQTIVSLPLLLPTLDRPDLAQHFTPSAQESIRRIRQAVIDVQANSGKPLSQHEGTFELWAEVLGMHARPYFSLLTSNILVTVPDIQMAHAALELVFRNSDNPHYSAYISAMKYVKQRHRAEWKPINYLLDEE